MCSLPRISFEKHTLHLSSVIKQLEEHITLLQEMQCNENLGGPINPEKMDKLFPTENLRHVPTMAWAIS